MSDRLERMLLDHVLDAVPGSAMPVEVELALDLDVAFLSRAYELATTIVALEAHADAPAGASARLEAVLESAARRAARRELAGAPVPTRSARALPAWAWPTLALAAAVLLLVVLARPTPRLDQVSAAVAITHNDTLAPSAPTAGSTPVSPTDTVHLSLPLRNAGSEWVVTLSLGAQSHTARLRPPTTGAFSAEFTGVAGVVATRSESGLEVAIPARALGAGTTEILIVVGARAAQPHELEALRAGAAVETSELFVASDPIDLVVVERPREIE